MIIMKWPLSIGERDRVSQYDRYVKPLSAEDKILITQRAHRECQRDLNRILKLLERAIVDYSASHYGEASVINRLGDARKYILDLKEDVKKRTYNALPYSEMNQERIDEGEFMDSRPRLSRFQKLLVGLGVGNVLVYVAGLVLKDMNIVTIGVFYTLFFGLALYLRWNRGVKTVGSVKRMNNGPKIF